MTFNEGRAMLLHALIAMLACWIQRHQELAIVYVREENRLLQSRLKGHRLALTDADRRRLAIVAHPINRKRLKEVATLVTVETLHRWYRCLVAQPRHDTAPHKKSGRPRVATAIEHLVVRMAEGNASWGYPPYSGSIGEREV